MIYYDKEKKHPIKPEDIKQEGVFTLIKPHVDKIYVYGNACVVTYNTTVYAYDYSDVYRNLCLKPVFLHDNARGDHSFTMIRKPHFIFYLRYLIIKFFNLY
jgi:hypothetical protein